MKSLSNCEIPCYIVKSCSKYWKSWTMLLCLCMPVCALLLQIMKSHFKLWNPVLVLCLCKFVKRLIANYEIPFQIMKSHFKLWNCNSNYEIPFQIVKSCFKYWKAAPFCFADKSALDWTSLFSHPKTIFTFGKINCFCLKDFPFGKISLLETFHFLQDFRFWNPISYYEISFQIMKSCLWLVVTSSEHTTYVAPSSEKTRK